MLSNPIATIVESIKLRLRDDMSVNIPELIGQSVQNIKC